MRNNTLNQKLEIKISSGPRTFWLQKEQMLFYMMRGQHIKSKVRSKTIKRTWNFWAAEKTNPVPHVEKTTH